MFHSSTSHLSHFDLQQELLCPPVYVFKCSLFLVEVFLLLFFFFFFLFLFLLVFAASVN